MPANTESNIAPTSIGGTEDPKVGASPTPSERTPYRRMIEVLRIGLGIVWLSNLFFIVYPPNEYFGKFG